MMPLPVPGEGWADPDEKEKEKEKEKDRQSYSSGCCFWLLCLKCFEHRNEPWAFVKHIVSLAAQVSDVSTHQVVLGLHEVAILVQAGVQGRMLIQRLCEKKRSQFCWSTKEVSESNKSNNSPHLVVYRRFPASHQFGKPSGRCWRSPRSSLRLWMQKKVVALTAPTGIWARWTLSHWDRVGG